MERRRAFENRVADSIGKARVERSSVPKNNEQPDRDVAAFAFARGKDFADFVDAFERAVDLGGPDPNAARLQRRVAAAVDDDATFLRELDLVAMTPDPREPLE